MNLDSNSLPPAGDDALEARIVAWVLGEASPFEAAELEKLCAENPHLRAFERRIRDLNELLAEDAKPGLHASWQLPAEKRGKVMDLLETAADTGACASVCATTPSVADAKKIVRYFSRRSLIAAAACLAISLVAYSMFGSIGVKARYAASESAVKSVTFSPSPGGGGQAEDAVVYSRLAKKEPASESRRESGASALASGAPEDFATLTEEVRYKIDSEDKRRGGVEAGQAIAANQPQRPAGPSAVSAPATPPPPPAAAPLAPPAEQPPVVAAVGDEAMPGDLVPLQSGAHDLADRGRGDSGGFAGGAPGVGGGGGALGFRETNGPVGAGPPMPAKPGASAMDGKELAEAGRPAGEPSVASAVTGGNRSGDGEINRNNIDASLNKPDHDARAKSKGDAVPGSGPMVANGVIAGEKLSESALGLKDAEVSRKKSELADLSAVDRLSAAAAPEAKAQTATPAEPQGLGRAPALAADDSDFETATRFSRQQAQEGQAQLEQKGAKSGAAWYTQDEGMKRELSVDSYGLLMDSTVGGLKADLSKNLEGKDALADGATAIEGVGAVPPAGDPAITTTGAWNSWGAEFSKQSQPAEAAAAAAGNGRFRGYLLSGSGQTLDGTSALQGHGIDLDHKPALTDFDGFVQYGTPIDANGGLATLNPMLRPPGGMPTELDVVQGAASATPGLYGYFSQTDAQRLYFDTTLASGAERSNAPATSFSLGLDALPAPENRLGGQTDFGNRGTRHDANDLAWSDASSAGVGITREFDYPKEYEAPELPQAVGGPVPGQAQTGGIFPVTPATPSDFLADRSAQPAGGDSSGLAQKEILRRQSAVRDADRLLLEGRDAYAAGRYEEATAKYKESLGSLPEAPLTEDRRKMIQQHLSDSATALGDAYRRVGKYEEARQLAAEVVALDPNNADAKRVNEWLDDPFRGQEPISREHAENIKQVREALNKAEAAYGLGMYDDAVRQYEDTIRIDPYNKAARRGLERVAQARTDYYRAAYDHTRAELLAKVDKSWELSVPPVGSGKPGLAGTDVASKVREIRIPEVQVENASVGEMLDFLRTRSRELDTATADPAKKGISFALGKPASGELGIDPEKLVVPKLDLKDVSLGELLTRIADETGLELQMDEHAVTLKPGPNTKGKQAEQILDKMGEIAAASEAFSTFSLHVSDASFKMAKAALDRGEQPAAEGIRPEEFYNAFDYGDPAPAQGEPVVCATEQCAHPAVPQRNLLRIGVRTAAAGRGASTPLNLTLLLDSSGSMERPDRQAAMSRAVAQLSGLLKEGDTITVAGFARQPRLLADRLPGARAQELNAIVAQTPSEGGTNLEEGLKLAEELAKRQFNPAAQNRIVLFTDGAANLGDAKPESLRGRVEQLRQQNIAFDAAGFGADGLNDRLLEQLTRNGNGRYYIVDRAEEAGENFAKQLAGAFRPAAENVKVQVRFNPARVARYKLLGFEEHRLKKEDFRNDAVDAAEMAAEEAGNALYQFEPLPNGEGQVGEVSVRFRDAASGQMVERTWTIPYDAQAAAFDRATPSIQLAGLAAFAAEKLRQAPLSDALDFKELGKSFPAVKAKYPDSQPVRDLGGMIEKLK